MFKSLVIASIISLSLLVGCQKQTKDGRFTVNPPADCIQTITDTNTHKQWLIVKNGYSQSVIEIPEKH